MAQMQKRVLLVDDSDLDRMILKTMIEDEFDVSIPTRRMQGIRTVADLMNELDK